MGRFEQLQQQHDKKARKLGMPDKSVDGKSEGKGTRSIVIRIAPGIVILAALILGGVIWLSTGTGSDTDSQLAVVGNKYRHAVGLVAAAVTTPDGTEQLKPLATAWSVKPGVAATNAHVALGLVQLAREGIDSRIIVNGRPDLKLRILSVCIHPNFSPDPANSDIQGIPFACDVAVLRHDGEFPNHFPIADAGELESINSGYRVAYLGFPMENLIGGNVNPDSPVATMQSGIVTAVTDFSQSDAGAVRNRLIKHNLGITGGASGSPLFNVHGEVVGIINGMNILARIMPDDKGEPVLVRAPSAAMVNFAQRVDLLNDVSGQNVPLSKNRHNKFSTKRAK